MPRRIPLIAIACGSLVWLSCDNSAEPPDGPPRIHFAQHKRDLGEIPITPEGRDVVFRFVNRGLSELRVTGLVSSCGCDDVNVENPLVAPGAEATITVRIISQQSEARSASVTVHSNDPARPRVVLQVSWRAVAPLEFEPLSLNFGALLPAQRVEQTVKLLQHGADPQRAVCRVEQVECFPSGQVSAAFVEQPATADSVAHKLLRVSLTAGENSGAAHGRIVVTLQVCWRESLTIPVSWRVQDVIEATPARLFLGSGRGGEVFAKNVLILARPGEVLKIKNIRFQNQISGARATWKRLTSSQILVHVEYELSEMPGRQTRELIVQCTEPVVRTVRVPVSAYVLQRQDNIERGVGK